MITIPYDPDAPELFENGERKPFIRVGEEMIIVVTQDECDNWLNENVFNEQEPSPE